MNVAFWMGSKQNMELYYVFYTHKLEPSFVEDDF